MKKDYFIFELFRSGPFLLLLILGILIALGIILVNRHKETVKMKEDVMYVSPPPKN
ncbi:MAG TPA: hypothetical protein VJ963_12035 [Bacteroidales bacterium]|nr:hypothetical protein [Bacteroidales bacterium]